MRIRVRAVRTTTGPGIFDPQAWTNSSTATDWFARPLCPPPIYMDGSWMVSR
jgi:hypothetical protein